MDCSPPSFSVPGIFQARMLEQVAISFFRGSSQGSEVIWPRTKTYFFCFSSKHFVTWKVWDSLREAWGPGSVVSPAHGMLSKATWFLSWLLWGYEWPLTKCFLLPDISVSPIGEGICGCCICGWAPVGPQPQNLWLCLPGFAAGISPCVWEYKRRTVSDSGWPLLLMERKLSRR